MGIARAQGLRGVFAEAALAFAGFFDRHRPPDPGIQQVLEESLALARVLGDVALELEIVLTPFLSVAEGLTPAERTVLALRASTRAAPGLRLAVAWRGYWPRWRRSRVVVAR
jgi:hypothetical protein